MDDNVPSMLEPHYAEPFTAWQKTPTPETSAGLLKAINPVLTGALRQYSIPDSPTLRSRAKIMALKSMGRYDPTKAKLQTFLYSQLQGLRRYTAQEQQILTVPEQVGLDLGYVRSAENELRDKLGREPSELEIADHTKLSPKRLAYIRRARQAAPEGMFHKSTGEGEDLYAPSIQERPGNVKHWHKMVYHDLAPIDQVIMEHTLGMHNKPILQNQELAKKLGISPGAVSQRKARIQSKLDMRDALKLI